MSVPAENCDAAPSGSPPQHSSTPPAEPGYRDPNSLVLICYGGGSRPTVQNNPTYQWNATTHKWEWSNIVSNASRSEEHTSELQSLMRISYAVFCLNNKHSKEKKAA